MKSSWRWKLPLALCAYHIIVCALIIGMRREDLLITLLLLELPVLPALLPLAFFIPIRGNPAGGGLLVAFAIIPWIGYGLFIGSWLDRRAAKLRNGRE